MSEVREAAPERFVLAVADIAAEDLPRAVSGDAGGDHDGHGYDLAGGVADVQVGRIHVDIGELDMPERAGAERANDLVQAGTDPRHLRLGDPGLGAHRLDQVIDRAGGDAVHVGLHHHGVEGLVNTAAWLEDGREERPGAQLISLDLSCW